MNAKPIMIPLGELTVLGRDIRFRPSKHAPPALRAGSQVSVAVRYRCVEGCAHAERTSIRLEVQMEDEPPVATEVTLRDRPVVRDEQWGALACAWTVSRSGRIAGRYRIQVEATAHPWLSKKRVHEARGDAEGELVVDAVEAKL